MVINNVLFEKIKNSIGLDTVPLNVSNAILDEVGIDILGRAVQNFLLTQGEWEQQSFELWVEAHSGEKDMLEKLVTLYPVFGNFLIEEILAFKATT